MFDNDFLWGCSTAGIQVERELGNADWDIFVNTPEIRERVRAFHDRASGGTVDIQYEAPGEAVGYESLDVLRVELDRLVALGLNAYRFSVEWNRVQPTAPPAGDPGGGVFDPAWRDHNLQVLREVIQREMRPVITLNHMSLPAWALTPPVKTRMLGPFGVSNLPVAAEDDQWRGSLRGWETDEVVTAYVAFVRFFASAANERFPDTRLLWATINEPTGSMVGVGYLGALWSPGFGGEADRGKRVCLHLVKAHVLAYQALKAINPEWQVGVATQMLHATPTSFSSAVAGIETGAGAGATAGAVTGAMLGFALRGPLGLLIGLIAGAVAGAITGAVAGGVVGGSIGAAVGRVVGDAQNVQQRSTNQFDYFYNEWMLRALVRGEIDTDLTVGTTRTAAEWDEAWGRASSVMAPAGGKQPRLCRPQLLPAGPRLLSAVG